ncbi:RidA family protein [Paraburkholderia sp. SIMBA_049]
MVQSIEGRLAELDIVLPTPKKTAARYVAAKLVGNTLYVSGTMPLGDAGPLWKGVVGKDVSIAEAQKATTAATVLLLAHAKEALGSLERIRQTLRLEVFVRAVPDFEDHPQVANAASELLLHALADKGTHARFAVGVAGLPFGVPVEVAATFAID